MTKNRLSNFLLSNLMASYSTIYSRHMPQNNRHIAANVRIIYIWAIPRQMCIFEKMQSWNSRLGDTHKLQLKLILLWRKKPFVKILFCFRDISE